MVFPVDVQVIGISMASLSAALNGQSQLVRGPGGALQEDKTLQQKASQIGLAAAPTTPGGAAMIGATPKSADMAGTPAQLSAALNKTAAAVQPQASLSTALRQQQSRTQATGQEQQKMQKSADMQALGGLGDRVTNFIQTQRDILAHQQATTLQANAPAAEGPDLSAELAKLATNPNDQQALLDINTKLGKDANSLLTAEQVRQMFKSDIEAIGQGASGAIANNMNVSNLFQDPEFGYNPTELSQLLGVPEADLSNYTVDQLQEKINQVTQQEFNQSSQTQQQSIDPNAGQAERQLAQQQGRELSTTGIRATEADVSKLNDAIQKGDQITFGGQQMSLADALADDNISGLVKEYIEGSPEFKKHMEESEPALANFIKSNQAVLAEATAQIEAGTTEFGKTQEYNKNLTKIGGIPMDDSLVKILLPNTGKLSATKTDIANIPVLKYAEGLNPQEQKTYINELNMAAKNYPGIGDELSKLSESEIKNLGMGQNSKNWRTYKAAQDEVSQINSIDSSDYNNLINQFSPKIMSVDQINNDIDTNSTLDYFGFADPSFNLGEIPLSGGKVDPSKLKTKLQGLVPTPTLKGASEGTTKPNAEFAYNAPKVPDNNTTQGRIMNAFKDWGSSKYIPGKSGDPNQTMADMQNIVSKISDPNNHISLEDLRDSGTLQKWGYDYNSLKNSMWFTPINQAPITAAASAAPNKGTTVSDIARNVVQANIAPVTGQIAAANRVLKSKVKF